MNFTVTLILVQMDEFITIEMDARVTSPTEHVVSMLGDMRAQAVVFGRETT